MTDANVTPIYSADGKHLVGPNGFTAMCASQYDAGKIALQFCAELARIKTLETALYGAAGQFDFYAQQHRAKLIPDVEKAKTNEEVGAEVVVYEPQPDPRDERLKELYDVLKLAANHLDYCGYGDAYE